MPRLCGGANALKLRIVHSTCSPSRIRPTLPWEDDPIPLHKPAFQGMNPHGALSFDCPALDETQQMVVREVHCTRHARRYSA